MQVAGVREQAYNASRNAQCAMRNAQCAIRNAQFAIRNSHHSESSGCQNHFLIVA
jgi:Tfp pilus assembly protein PilX